MGLADKTSPPVALPLRTSDKSTTILKVLPIRRFALAFRKCFPRYVAAALLFDQSGQLPTLFFALSDQHLGPYKNGC